MRLERHRARPTTGGDVKGVLFCVVQDVVETEYGADAWDDVIALAGVDGAYTSLGNYPDIELVAIVNALRGRIEGRAPDVLVMLGRRGFDRLARRHVELLEEFDGWRIVLRQLDAIVHPEVQKIYPDAAVPRFDISDVADGIRLVYRSERNLCALAEGLALGLGDHYGTSLDVRHESCRLRGDADCVLIVSERG